MNQSELRANTCTCGRHQAREITKKGGKTRATKWRLAWCLLLIGGESRTECFVKQSPGIGMRSQNILKIRQFLNRTKPLLEFEGKNERDCRLTLKKGNTRTNLEN